MYLTWESILILLLFTIIIEHLLLYLQYKKNIYFSYSSLSTSIGVMLMMVSVQLWVYMVVIVLGLLQKHILRIEGRHFFNPSNFALLMALSVFYDEAHIVLGQLGDDYWVITIVVVLAGMLLWRAERWIIPLIFSFAYLTFEYLLIVSYDQMMITMDVIDRFLSVSFIVFIVFMLTDPRTTPVKPQYQIIFAICIALGASILDFMQGFRVQHLFFSLAFFSPWVVIISLWGHGKNQRRMIIVSSLILVFVVSVISFIEMKPPYYFSMDG